MKQIGSMKVFEAAELCDTLAQIRVAITQTIYRERPDIDVLDPKSGYLIVQRLRNISGQNISLRQALKMKDYWRRIVGEHPSLSDCEQFCYVFKDILK